MGIRICLSIEKMGPEFAQMEAKLKEVAQVDVVDLKPDSIAGYDIFVGKKMTKELLATADKLKCIFAYKTGVDDFPLEELAAKGVKVINSHADADYIAQYAFGLAISLVNRITEFDHKFRQGIWYDTENPYWKSLFEMKVGLVGFGQIGQRINNILVKNGIQTYTINRGKEYKNVSTVDSLEDLCDTCDLIILSLPRTSETNSLINKELLEHLKGKYLVNVGRGNCIDDQALFDALKSGQLAGAAIDTWDQKAVSGEVPFYPTSQPFQELTNTILSPHQAMKVPVGHLRYVEDTTEKIIDYIQTGKLRDIVDLKKGY